LKALSGTWPASAKKRSEVGLAQPSAMNCKNPDPQQATRSFSPLQRRAFTCINCEQAAHQEMNGIENNEALLKKTPRIFVFPFGPDV
jgi:hypothetical protein